MENSLAKPHSAPVLEHGLDRPLGAALSEFAARHTETVVCGSAEEMLGPGTASSLHWSDCTLVRLPGANGELAGLLCLSGRSAPLEQEDRVFLETMAGHAAMVLGNARQFTRIEQANRHWMEIFDAITDFIVVHDQADKVLRVNRSLAEMIGVPAKELIGVNMRALMASDQRHGVLLVSLLPRYGRRFGRIRAPRIRSHVSGFDLARAWAVR